MHTCATGTALPLAAPQKKVTFLDFLKIFDKIILNGIFGLTYTPSNDFVYINMQVLQQILKERNMQASEFVYVHFMPPGHSIANQVDGRGTCNMEEGNNMV